MAEEIERVSVLLPKAEAQRLRAEAKARGYIIHSGQNVGEGSISALIRAMARGQVTLPPIIAPMAEGGSDDLVEQFHRIERAIAVVSPLVDQIKRDTAAWESAFEQRHKATIDVEVHEPVEA